MSDRIGGDLGVMTNLKSQFDRQGATIESLVSELDGAVNSVIGPSWFGPAANRFRDDWQSIFRPNLLKLHDALSAAAQEVQNRRDRLQEAGG